MSVQPSRRFRHRVIDPAQPQPTLFSPYTLGDIALEQPARAVADDAQPRARRQCREPAGRDLLRAARVGRPDDHRGHAGQPAGRRLYPHARHPFARAGRRLEARSPTPCIASAARSSRSSGMSAASRIRISTAAHCRSRRRRCRSTAKPSPATARSRSRRRARSRPARSRGIVEQFRKGAENAKAAGFDGVELHGANGYLLDQFLRDGSNQRTDAYGGSLAKRARLPLEVAEAVAGVFGASRVGYKLSPYFPGYSMSDSNPIATFSHYREGARQARPRLSARVGSDRRTDEGRRHRARHAVHPRGVRRHADRERRLRRRHRGRGDRARRSRPGRVRRAVHRQSGPAAALPQARARSTRPTRRRSMPARRRATSTIRR